MSTQERLLRELLERYETRLATLRAMKYGFEEHDAVRHDERVNSLENVVEDLKEVLERSV